MGRAYQNRKESMAKTAAAKTKVYSKYGREIYMAAKAGGIDPQANLSLRGLIERAKKTRCPPTLLRKPSTKPRVARAKTMRRPATKAMAPATAWSSWTA